MVQHIFPVRLHALLDQSCDSYLHDEARIISWTPDGKRFIIHDLGVFKTRILPKYFPKQSKYKSFRRQLQYYGFSSYGSSRFGHPFFLRKNKELLAQVKHKVTVKKQTKKSGPTKPTLRNEHNNLSLQALQEQLSQEIARESIGMMNQARFSLDTRNRFEQHKAVTEIMQPRHVVLHQSLIGTNTNFQVTPLSALQGSLTPFRHCILNAIEQEISALSSRSSLLSNQLYATQQVDRSLFQLARNQSVGPSIDMSSVLKAEDPRMSTWRS
ncbi:unnamed protein product [Cylindrotheca closterium]|uniref:HSF-type DNA-binding domain-containing protein n=1 Tax=Cylindrotheca closterium TaxID=2856 RepID=A0AAD2G146_9STRA|nr:unnamed protein product [Cylindrotheca closterium]